LRNGSYFSYHYVGKFYESGYYAKLEESPGLSIFGI